MALLVSEGWLGKNVGVDGKNIAVSATAVGAVAAGAEQLAINARATRTIDSAVQEGHSRRRRVSARRKHFAAFVKPCAPTINVLRVCKSRLASIMLRGHVLKTVCFQKCTKFCRSYVPLMDVRQCRDDIGKLR